MIIFKSDLLLNKKFKIQKNCYHRFQLDLVNTFKVSWIKRYKLDDVIYMGDGLFDSLVMKKVRYSICPTNANEETKKLQIYDQKRWR